MRVIELLKDMLLLVNDVVDWQAVKSWRSLVQSRFASGAVENTCPNKMKVHTNRFSLKYKRHTLNAFLWLFKRQENF